MFPDSNPKSHLITAQWHHASSLRKGLFLLSKHWFLKFPFLSRTREEWPQRQLPIWLIFPTTKECQQSLDSDSKRLFPKCVKRASSYNSSFRGQSCGIVGKAVICTAGILNGHQFVSYVLSFWCKFLLVGWKKPQKMIQVLESVPPTWETMIKTPGF